MIINNTAVSKQEVESHFDVWKSPEGSSLHAADCMQQLLELVRHHKVNIDGNVCTVIVTTMVLEVIFAPFFFVENFLYSD